ncbi:MAG: hypothetical protein HZC24_08690 [Rhodocyclales bacterium]|nr:hypothetical protein [Rhodocyclales bacterium]
MSEDEDKAARRSAAIAALRRLRQLVDAENRQQASDARWAARLGAAFLAAALLWVAWLAFR